MKIWVFLFGIMFSTIVSCKSQETTDKGSMTDRQYPKEEIKVNREYDEDGNLIRYDSTYMSFYSDFARDTAKADSVIFLLPGYLNEHMGNIFSNHYTGIDSLDQFWFFNDDFFEKQFREQNRRMLKMMQEMDSLKNEYFQQFSGKVL
jgi:hypothetical protein